MVLWGWESQQSPSAGCSHGDFGGGEEMVLLHSVGARGSRLAPTTV